jgi:hypothetical protein
MLHLRDVGADAAFAILTVVVFTAAGALLAYILV